MGKLANVASLWLVWVVACTLGLALASWITFHVSGRLLFTLSLTGLDPQFSGLFRIPIQLAISGAALGVAQWLVLRRYVSRIEWWPAGTALGALAAAPFLVLVALLFYHLLTTPEAIVYALLTGCLVGIFISLAQLRVMTPNVGVVILWSAAGLAGYGLGALATMAMSVFLSVPFDSLFGATTGAIAGVITGAALVRIVDRERPLAVSGRTVGPV